MVVIEDLHWADPFTLDLLTYLVAGTRTGATFVVTLRTDQRPMPPASSRPSPSCSDCEGTVTVELGPLPTNVVAQQAEEVLGRRATAAAWWRSSSNSEVGTRSSPSSCAATPRYGTPPEG